MYLICLQEPIQKEVFHPEDPPSAPEILILEHNSQASHSSQGAHPVPVKLPDKSPDNIGTFPAPISSTEIKRLNNRPAMSFLTDTTKLESINQTNLGSICGKTTPIKLMDGKNCEIDKMRSVLPINDRIFETRRNCAPAIKRDSIEDRMEAVEATLVGNKRVLNLDYAFKTSKVARITASSVLQTNKNTGYEKDYLKDLQKINQTFVTSSSRNQSTFVSQKSLKPESNRNKEDILNKIYGCEGKGSRTSGANGGKGENIHQKSGL